MLSNVPDYVREGHYVNHDGKPKKVTTIQHYGTGIPNSSFAEIGLADGNNVRAGDVQPITEGEKPDWLRVGATISHTESGLKGTVLKKPLPSVVEQLYYMPKDEVEAGSPTAKSLMVKLKGFTPTTFLARDGAERFRPATKAELHSRESRGGQSQGWEH